MHPALSVILFTTLSGAGYGLLGALALSVLVAGAPPPWLSGLALAGGLGAATAGLLASTFHLGRPERAWRALSQVGSSWLSREGVLALLLYPAVLVFGWGLLRGPFDGAWPLAAALVLLLALAVVTATGMIYASLKPVPAWRHPLVVPGYLLFAALGGSLWLAALELGFGGGPRSLPSLIAVLLCLLGLALKARYWRDLDRQSRRPPADPASALALPAGSRAVLLDPPQSQEGYVQREMGFRVARKHARRLRRIAALCAFLLPALAAALALAVPWPWLAATVTALAALLSLLGLLVERWLFFAEARHVVTAYYGG